MQDEHPAANKRLLDVLPCVGGGSGLSPIFHLMYVQAMKVSDGDRRMLIGVAPRPSLKR